MKYLTIIILLILKNWNKVWSCVMFFLYFSNCNSRFKYKEANFDNNSDAQIPIYLLFTLRCSSPRTIYLEFQIIFQFFIMFMCKFMLRKFYWLVKLHSPVTTMIVKILNEIYKDVSTKSSKMETLQTNQFYCG